MYDSLSIHLLKNRDASKLGNHKELMNNYSCAGFSVEKDILIPKKSINNGLSKIFTVSFILTKSKPSEKTVNTEYK